MTPTPTRAGEPAYPVDDYQCCYTHNALTSQLATLTAEVERLRQEKAAGWVPSKACVVPTHEAADAFWKYWRENGETHKHGYYESTWGAINAALNSTGQLDAATSREAALREALRKAVEIIKVWHNCDEVWDVYYCASPEMKPVRQALAGKGERP